MRPGKNFSRLRFYKCDFDRMKNLANFFTIICFLSLFCGTKSQQQQPILQLQWDGSTLTYSYTDQQGNSGISGTASPGQVVPPVYVPPGTNIVSTNTAGSTYSASGFTYGLPVIFCYDSQTPNSQSGVAVIGTSGCSTCVSGPSPPTGVPVGYGSNQAGQNGQGGNYGPGYLVTKFCSVASCLDLAKGPNSGSQTVRFGNAPLTVTVGNIYGNIGRRPNPNYAPPNQAGYIVLNIVPQTSTQGAQGVWGGSGGNSNSWGPASNNQNGFNAGGSGSSPFQNWI